MELEEAYGDQGSLTQLKTRLPKRIKKKRPVRNVNGANVGWEEFYDYIFPDDDAPSLKLLEMAHKWKKTNI